jgi:hypothetical protein
LLVAGADKFTSSRIMSWYLGFEYTWEEMSWFLCSVLLFLVHFFSSDLFFSYDCSGNKLNSKKKFKIWSMIHKIIFFFKFWWVQRNKRQTFFFCLGDEGGGEGFGRMGGVYFGV